MFGGSSILTMLPLYFIICWVKHFFTTMQHAVCIGNLVFSGRFVCYLVLFKNTVGSVYSSTSLLDWVIESGTLLDAIGV